MKGNGLLIRIFLILFCFTWSLSSASEVSLNASVSPEKGTVGVPLAYTLTISGIDPASLKITLPEKKIVYPDIKKEKADTKKSEDEQSPEQFVPVYIINSASRDESVVNGNSQVNLKLVLRYYRPGTYTLPEIKIAVGGYHPTLLHNEMGDDADEKKYVDCVWKMF